MYDLSPALDATVQPGTNILLAGPPLTGKRALGFDVIAGGIDAGEGAVVVSTKDSAQRVLNEFESRFDIDDEPLTVIDCVTRQQGISDVTESDHVKYASSPVDMTGIGIKFSEVLEEYYQVRGLERNRVMLHSLSTLLMYSDLQTVFRFLHVFTGRVQSIDGLGLFSIDSTAHDDQTMNTLKQLFDGIITTHEDGEPTVRLP
ncbi:recombinase RecA [Salinigranum rubrum]|uniref:Recombinase RecA n=1 Tax=Salinigranum rubrum TaxID=755307 RepID=A0A2I8VIH0_9EURY|nr:recombinase RecA [Salinigranum rubrum]AUV81684.1 recombinase RecA [Salinigranum rubrum]